MTKNTIQIEATPNPATMVFRFSEAIIDKPYDFPNAQEAETSPLASKIFGFPWTSSVHIGTHFVSVTKQNWVDWEVLAEPLANIICEHVKNGEPLYEEISLLNEDESAISPYDSPLVKQLKQIINREIRPIVAYDGGDVVFAGLEENKLFLHFKGACAGCPSKSVTLKQNIEVRIKELCPEITEVIAT